MIVEKLRFAVLQLLILEAELQGSLVNLLGCRAGGPANLLLGVVFRDIKSKIGLRLCIYQVHCTTQALKEHNIVSGVFVLGVNNCCVNHSVPSKMIS